MSSKIRVNGDLRGTPRVRVFASGGEDLGVMKLGAALEAAMACGLDLVEVNPRVDPPVCKLLDFSAISHEALKRRQRPSDPEEGT